MKDGVVRGQFHNVSALDTELLLEKIRQADLADEAQALRVFFLCRREVDVGCNATHLRLLEFSDGKQGSAELLLIELTQEVALVFVAVLARQQVMHALGVGVLAAVVARGHRVGTQFQRGVEEQVKLDLPVAQHVGVGGATCSVFREHVVHDALFVLGAQVHDLKRDAEVIGHEHGVVGVVDPGAFVVDGDALVVPVAHEQSDHFVTLLKQEMSSYARIHTTG